jgi:ABC-type amino acid transport system permease subunit
MNSCDGRKPTWFRALIAGLFAGIVMTILTYLVIITLGVYTGVLKLNPTAPSWWVLTYYILYIPAILSVGIWTGIRVGKRNLYRDE